MKNHVIYLAFNEGKITRGSYLTIGVKDRHYTEWAFRPEPVLLDHFYGNMDHQVKITKLHGSFVVTQYMKFRPVSQTNVSSLEKIFLIIRERQGIERTKTGEAENLIACLRNRMNEYKGAPIIPMSKGLTKFKERWVA